MGDTHKLQRLASAGLPKKQLWKVPGEDEETGIHFAQPQSFLPHQKE